MSRNKYNVLAFSCVHAPAMHKKFPSFLKKVAKDWNINKVVCLGDLADWGSISYHEKPCTISNPHDEFLKARKQIAQLYKAFPRAEWLIGNHDDLPKRKARTAELPEDVLIRPYRELFDVHGWKVHDRFTDLIIDGVIYRHGDKGKGGRIAAFNNALRERMPVVQGHWHGQWGVESQTNDRDSVWGMQVGCVDKDTEYMSPNGWRKISEYDGGKVLQYNENGSATLEQPLEYIKVECDDLLHFENSYGLEMKLCDNHDVVYVTRGGSLKKMKASDVAFKQENHTNGFERGIPVSFIGGQDGVNITDEQLRLQIAFMADGTIRSRQGIITVKKQRKKDRIVKLLEDAGVSFSRSDYKDGCSRFRFTPPVLMKMYPDSWYAANQHQLQIIVEECLLWDGNQKNRFTSKHKSDADFIQYAASAIGLRTSLRHDSREDKSTYDVTFSKGKKLRYLSKKGGSPVERIPTKDGYKYCFTMPSGMLILRCNDSIFITGNCGVDGDSAAMDYGKKFSDKPTLGCGVIIKGEPFPIRMPL